MTPILTDLPPQEQLSRPDGTHSGNKAVRAAIAKGEPQTMAWARERPDGGRGFGITGGHFHWNWGNDNFRKLVLNAIVWAAHVDVPADGVPSRPLTVEELEANQDKTAAGRFQPGPHSGAVGSMARGERLVTGTGESAATRARATA